jgi:hypothetical protein
MQNTATCLAPGGSCDCIQTYVQPRVTLTNAGETGLSIIGNGIGPKLTVKTLVEGTGIDLIEGPTGSITIAQDPAYSNVTLVGQGTGPGVTSNLVIDGTGPDLVIKNLVAGNGVVFSDDPAGPLVINTVDASITLSGTGPVGVNMVTDGSGPTLQIRNVVAGNGISLGLNGESLQITNSSPATDVTLAGFGGADSLVVNGAAPFPLTIKGLTGMNGFAVSSTTLPNGTPVGMDLVGFGPRYFYRSYCITFNTAAFNGTTPTWLYFPTTNFDTARTSNIDVPSFWFGSPLAGRLVYVSINAAGNGGIISNAQLFMVASDSTALVPQPIAENATTLYQPFETGIGPGLSFEQLKIPYGTLGAPVGPNSFYIFGLHLADTPGNSSAISAGIYTFNAVFEQDWNTTWLPS